MDFKQQFNYNNQADQKRERFRKEIRRKNIQCYQSQIRSIRLLAERDEKQQMKRFKFIHPQPFQTPSYGQQKDHEEQNTFALINRTYADDEEEISWMQINCKQRQNLNRLQEMSLTQAWKLCKVQTLDELTKIVSQSQLNLFYDKVQKILVKMCINEAYWNQKFLLSLFPFLFEVQRLGMDIEDYLISLSQCSVLEFKIILYREMMTLDIFKPSKQNQILSKRKIHSCAIHVLYNFILVPPFVMHDNKSLHPHQSQLTQQRYIQKVLNILALATSPSKEICSKNMLARITPQQKNKQFLTVLEIIYGLLDRLDGKQNSLIVESMERLEWNTMREVLHYYHKQSQVHNIKVKLKLFQIVHSIISVSNREDIVQNFLCTFLNPLLSIIRANFQSCMIKDENKLQSDTAEAHWQRQKSKGKKCCKQPKGVKRKYECMLLQVLSGLLNVHDELGQIPALKLITERYTNFFQQIYEVYLKHFTFDKINASHMCQIAVAILRNLQNAGQTIHLSIFLQDLILERTGAPVIQILSDILNQVLSFIRNQQQKNCQPSLLVISLKQNEIIMGLEKLVYGSYDGKNETCESLLELLSSYQI